MQERIIITMTTYNKRIGNIPTVLDTIYAQTVIPDLVVINLAYEEVVPDKVQNYINAHNIEVNRVPDTKVYKKIVPTLKKYPNDCVINIDDDKLYPPEMIADFMDIHKKHPYNPISGNRQVFAGRQCHHGSRGACTHRGRTARCLHHPCMERKGIRHGDNRYVCPQVAQMGQLRH